MTSDEDEPTGRSDEAKARETFEEVVDHFDTAMLVTQSADNTLRSRPMRIAANDGSGWLTFVTSIESSVVEEILWDREVNVAMQSSSRFLSITGAAECTRDPALIADIWNTGWKVWFPGGPEDEDLVIVRLLPERGEYWDSSGMKGLKYLVEAGKALATGQKIEIEDADLHASVDLMESPPGGDTSD